MRTATDKVDRKTEGLSQCCISNNAKGNAQVGIISQLPSIGQINKKEIQLNPKGTEH